MLDGARRVVRRAASVGGRRVGGLPRADRTRSAWAHAVAHNIELELGDMLVTETARRSGATTPSSSARCSSARRPTRCAACSTTCAPRSRRRSTRFAPASPAPTSTAPCSTTSRSTTAAVLAAARRPCDRPPQPRGAVPRRRRPHAGRARDGVHDRAGRVRDRGSAASATPTPSSSPRRDRDPHRLPVGHREPDDRLRGTTRVTVALRLDDVVVLRQPPGAIDLSDYVVVLRMMAWIPAVCRSRVCSTYTPAALVLAGPTVLSL